MTKMQGKETITGRVKWASPQRRYGFIERDDGKKDVFVHQNDARGVWLSEGDRVRFFVVQTPKGPRAFGVQQVSTLVPIDRSAVWSHDPS